MLYSHKCDIEEPNSAQVIAGCWIVYWAVVSSIFLSGINQIPIVSSFVCDVSFPMTLLLIGVSIALAKLPYRFFLIIALSMFIFMYLLKQVYCLSISLFGAIVGLLALLLLMGLCPWALIVASIAQPWSRNNLKPASSVCGCSKLDLSDIEPSEEGSWLYTPSDGDERLGAAKVEIYMYGKKKQDGILFVTRKGLTCRPTGIASNGGRALWRWLDMCKPLVEVSRNEIKFTIVAEGGGKIHLYANAPSQKFTELCQKIEHRLLGQARQ